MPNPLLIEVVLLILLLLSLFRGGSHIENAFSKDSRNSKFCLHSLIVQCIFFHKNLCCLKFIVILLFILTFLDGSMMASIMNTIEESYQQPNRSESLIKINFGSSDTLAGVAESSWKIPEVLCSTRYS